MASEPITVVAFHTDDALYSKCAEVLRNSLQEYGINFYMKIIPAGDWNVSCCFKPHFILDCLNTIEGTIIYTDADSCLKRKFDIYKDVPGDWDVAFPRAPWNEVLAGTIAFRGKAKQFVAEWIDALRIHGPHPKIGDQQQFQQMVKNKNYVCKPMPVNYCKIFDLMKNVPDPVFVHYQASRVGRAKQPPKTLLDRLGT